MATIVGTRNGAAQDGPTVGVDADPAGNTAISLGTIDSCISVKKGDAFQVDIFVTDVVNLLNWEVYFSFDGDVINVTDRDVQMFPAASAGSDVLDVSDVLPSSGGLYRLGAADLSRPPAVDSGSGVLGRLTLEAVGAGLSPAILTTLDANSDGKIDLGPLLSDAELRAIGDANGDGFFDGTVVNAQIAVDRDCLPGGVASPTASPGAGGSPVATPTGPSAATATPVSTATGSPALTATPVGTQARASPTSSPTVAPPDEEDGDGGPPWAIVGVIGGLAGLLLLAGGGAMWIRSTRR